MSRDVQMKVWWAFCVLFCYGPVIEFVGNADTCSLMIQEFD